MYPEMNSSSPNRSFLTRPFARRNDGDSFETQYPKGPLGLSTLIEPLGLAVADLVFVHGLGGGSRSTWTKDSDASLFWPQEWLQKDAGFRDVRVHSFGYNSDLEKQSILNIHDFARALLGSRLDCPRIPRDSTVCTAHSSPHFFKANSSALHVSFNGHYDLTYEILTSCTGALGVHRPQHGRTCNQESLYTCTTISGI